MSQEVQISDRIYKTMETDEVAIKPFTLGTQK
jgi:hypothetical protein